MGRRFRARPRSWAKVLRVWKHCAPDHPKRAQTPRAPETWPRTLPPRMKHIRTELGKRLRETGHGTSMLRCGKILLQRNIARSAEESSLQDRQCTLMARR